MKNIEMVVENLEKKLKNNNSNCSYKIYYDKFNLDKYRGNVEYCQVYLVKIIEILCDQKINQKICIRIHGYKQWLILRIVCRIEIDRKLIADIKSIWENDLVFFSIDESVSIIKLTY